MRRSSISWLLSTLTLLTTSLVVAAACGGGASPGVDGALDGSVDAPPDAVGDGSPDAAPSPDAPTPDASPDGPLPSGSVAQLAVGETHSCVRLTDGRVRCWGDGFWGKLGHGNIDDIGDDEPPAAAGDVPIGGAATWIAVGADHSCAVLDTGAVRCWGAGHFGQLGYGHTATIGNDEPASAAGDVPLGGIATQVTVGWYHTCALLDTGAVRCWGKNYHGQLGYGHTEHVGDDETPASVGDVPIGGTAVEISAGREHTCARLSSGAIRCFGQGWTGALGHGNGLSIGDDETPDTAGDAAIGGSAVEIKTGTERTCARLAGGALRCFGAAPSGELGYGNTENVGDDETPASVGDVPVGTAVTQVAIGHFHTCAILASGGVRCWGRGLSGALGTMSLDTIGDDEPASAGAEADFGGGAAEVGAGSHFTCVRLERGVVRCWGLNLDGQLGYGHTAAIGDDEPPHTAGDVPLE